jgi:hypothetical protein
VIAGTLDRGTFNLSMPHNAAALSGIGICFAAATSATSSM